MVQQVQPVGDIPIQKALPRQGRGYRTDQRNPTPSRVFDREKRSRKERRQKVKLNLNLE